MTRANGSANPESVWGEHPCARRPAKFFDVSPTSARVRSSERWTSTSAKRAQIGSYTKQTVRSLPSRGDQVEVSCQIEPVGLVRRITDEQWAEFCLLDQPRVAVHDAGHAVVACLERLKPCFARLITETNSGEVQLCCEYDQLADDSPLLAIKQKYLAGGAAAERLIFGTYHEHGCRGDRDEVNRLEICRRNIPSVQWRSADVFPQCVVEAFALLEREHVEGIAAALQQRDLLNRHEIREALEACM